MKGKKTLLNVVVVGLLLGVFLPSAPVVRADTITVTTTVDEYGTDSKTCSLREAITAANTDSAVNGCPAGNGIDTIQLGIGTYQLSIAGTGDDSNLTGDLDILDGLILSGAGSRSTIIDGGRLDRVFDVGSGIKVTIEDLSVRNGQVPHGADGTDGPTPNADGTTGGNGQPGAGRGWGGVHADDRPAGRDAAVRWR